MIVRLVRKAFGSGKQKAAADRAFDKLPSRARPEQPEWERVLTASLEQNSAAPSDDAILHAFDLYCEALYAPFQERRQEMIELHGEIVADVSALQARVPDLIERAMSRHPFEFSYILEHKDTHQW